MTDTHDAHLGEHEAMYLAMVGEQLDGLSAGRRAELLAVVADNLDERPPALSWDLLIAELGTPATYAAQLVDGPIRRARRTPKQRLQRRRRWLAGAFIGAVAAGLIAPLVARPLRRTIAPAPPVHLSTNCWGVRSDDPQFTFEHLEAAGAQEYRMEYLEGATFRIPLCLSSSQKIEVLDVRAFDDYVENPTGSTRPIRCRCRGPSPSARSASLPEEGSTSAIAHHRPTGRRSCSARTRHSTSTW